MKPIRSVSVYYRDKGGVMRKIPNVKAQIHNGDVFRVYTLYPVKTQELKL